MQIPEYFGKYFAEILIDVLVRTSINILDKPIENELSDQGITFVDFGKGVSFRVEDRWLGRCVSQEAFIFRYDAGE